jgi:putative FmdB family regulatory protein
MPIYAYKCSSCGHEQDVLQKVSAAPLTNCPQCHGETYSKQLTAAGFHLKGSGWYQTDFKNGSGGAKAAPVAADSKGSDSSGSKTEKKETAAASTGGSCGHGGCSACS